MASFSTLLNLVVIDEEKYSCEKAKFQQSSPWKNNDGKIISLRNLDLKALTNSSKRLQILIGVARISTLNTRGA